MSRYRATPAERHPDNADGDFYVECDACISCEAPYHEAPDLMGSPGASSNNYGCFFRKQPSTLDEIERACDAIMVSCVEGVRYAGNDPGVLRSLYDRGAYASCDARPTEVEVQVIRHVEDNYRAAKRHGVHWTYIRDTSPKRVLIACCYGPYRHILGVFAFDEETGEIGTIKDDAEYRPRFDNFKRPKNGFWWW